MSKSITQDMAYRQSLMKYAEKYGAGNRADGEGTNFLRIPLEICRGIWYIIKQYAKINRLNGGRLGRTGGGGAAMEYIDMVGQIIAAEHRAKALAQEGARRGEELRAGLEQEKASLRESCLARAKTRVEMVRQAEQARRSGRSPAWTRPSARRWPHGRGL